MIPPKENIPCAETCAQLLKNCMLIYNLSCSQIACSLGISPQAVNQWLKGETVPNRKNREKLVDLLKLTTDSMHILEIRKPGVNRVDTRKKNYQEVVQPRYYY